MMHIELSELVNKHAACMYRRIIACVFRAERNNEFIIIQEKKHEYFYLYTKYGGFVL